MHRATQWILAAALTGIGINSAHAQLDTVTLSNVYFYPQGEGTVTGSFQLNLATNTITNEDI